MRQFAIMAVTCLGLAACTPEPQAATPTSAAFILSPDGTSGRSWGSLRLVNDGDDSEVCWRVELDAPPKALQLHQDETGPSDPVVVSLYEPPGDPKTAGCVSLEAPIARHVHADPEDFYVDGHSSDKTPVPVIWATLEPDAP